MKKIVIIILTLLVSAPGFSQKILKWSIGEAKVTCGEIVKVSYPLLVSVDDGSNSPVLGSSTMRLIYDAGVLKNFSIQNIKNGYSQSGLHKSNPVLGEIFGFDNLEGVFVQFDIMDNARVNPIYLSTTPTHVLDFSFEIDSKAKYPICTSFVLDNNPDGWFQGIAKDDGFIPGSAGIVGSYFLNSNYAKGFDADDEVINFSWDKANGPVGKIKKGKRIGQVNMSLCMKNSICNEQGKNDGKKSAIISQSLFNVYPIPFDQEVTVEYSFDYDTDVTLEIYDAKGSLISNIENKNYARKSQHYEKIDLSRVNTQLLIVMIKTNRNIETKKIVSVDTKRTIY